MRRFNIVVSDEAGEILDKLKKKNKWNSNDTAIDKIIMDKKSEAK